MYFSGFGKRKPVRQLKKAGGVFVRIQQNLYTHRVCKNKKGRLPAQTICWGSIYLSKLPFIKFFVPFMKTRNILTIGLAFIIAFAVQIISKKKIKQSPPATE